MDTLLTGETALANVFSFARAYFMVDTDVPSAVVEFLRRLLPSKTKAELYSAIGLHKHGKTEYYRDFLCHLRHSSDAFVVAPGIRGMVMTVFTLPSYPYVFKVIKDTFPAPKEMTRELVKRKYQLVKQHDRVGRMSLQAHTAGPLSGGRTGGGAVVFSGPQRRLPGGARDLSAGESEGPGPVSGAAPGSAGPRLLEAETGKHPCRPPRGCLPLFGVRTL